MTPGQGPDCTVDALFSPGLGPVLGRVPVGVRGKEQTGLAAQAQGPRSMGALASPPRLLEPSQCHFYTSQRDA